MANTPLRILIIRFSSIGDIVLTSPISRNLRQQYPNAEIGFATKKSFASIAEANPYIDRVFALEESFQVFKESVKSFAPTHVIDLHHNLRSKRLHVDLGAESQAFPKLNLEKWLLVNLKWNRLPNKHIVDRYFEAASHLNLENDQRGLDYFIPADTHVKLPEEKYYLTLAIGGQHATKKMPNDELAEILKQIPGAVVLLGGKEDQANAETIIQISKKPNLYNRCGDLSLNQSAFLVQHSIGLITHDTGMMHIGAALKVPILSIWGNTVPEFGMYPYFPQGHIAEQKSHMFQVQVNCRPCSKIGFESCPKKHFNCMRQQDLAAISSAAQQLFPA